MKRYTEFLEKINICVIVALLIASYLLILLSVAVRHITFEHQPEGIIKLHHYK